MTIAIEQFTNAASGSVGGTSQLIGDTTLTPVSYVGFPTSGQFRIQVDNEIELVTDASVTPWPVIRGIEGSTAAAHAIGAVVTQILTAAALKGLLYAARNGAPVSVQRGHNFIPGTDIGLAVADNPGTAQTDITVSQLPHAGPSPWIDVAHYGSVADAQVVTDGAITIGTALLTSASGKFSATDVGKAILVAGAGPTPGGYVAPVSLVTTVLNYQSATQVTLAANASATVTAAQVDWGTDNASAINTAIIAAHALPTGGTVFLGPGRWLVVATQADQNQQLVLNMLGNVTLRGAGRGRTTIRCGVASANVLWADGQTNFQVHDFTIDATNGGNCDCFKLDQQSSHFVLSNLEGIGSSGGFELQGGVTDIQVVNCVAHDQTQFPFAGHDGWGFKVAEHYSSLWPNAVGVARVQLSNCLAYNCVGEGFAIQGEDDTGTTGLIYRAEDVQLVNCHALNCGTSVSTGYGFLIWLAKAQLTNCTATGCWYGFRVRNAFGCTFAGCRSKNASESAWQIMGASDNGFAACVANDSGQQLPNGHVADGFAIFDDGTIGSSRNLFVAVVSGNTLVNTTQQYGWRNSGTHGGNNVVMAADFNANTTAGSLGVGSDTIFASLAPLTLDGVNGRVGIGGTPTEPLEVFADGSGNGPMFHGISRLRSINLTDYDLSSAATSGATATAWAKKVSGLMEWGDGTNSRDTFLQRVAAAILGTTGKFVATAGLGVGNSAAATTPGSVVKKVEIFDATGASLGFLAVYSAIT